MPNPHLPVRQLVIAGRASSVIGVTVSLRWHWGRPGICCVTDATYSWLCGRGIGRTGSMLR